MGVKWIGSCFKVDVTIDDVLVTNYTAIYFVKPVYWKAYVMHI